MADELRHTSSSRVLAQIERGGRVRRAPPLGRRGRRPRRGVRDDDAAVPPARGRRRRGGARRAGATVRSDGVAVPGVTGFLPEARDFATRWADATGAGTRPVDVAADVRHDRRHPRARGGRRNARGRRVRSRPCSPSGHTPSPARRASAAAPAEIARSVDSPGRRRSRDRDLGGRRSAGHAGRSERVVAGDRPRRPGLHASRAPPPWLRHLARGRLDRRAPRPRHAPLRALHRPREPDVELDLPGGRLRPWRTPPRSTSLGGGLGRPASDHVAPVYRVSPAAARIVGSGRTRVSVRGELVGEPWVPPRICHTTTMILVGVCGGIAAYKTCELVRLLVKDGHDVQVVQTPDSRRFVGPTTFAALSRRPVADRRRRRCVPASRRVDAVAELLCIAPLSATTMSRIAHGEAANVLTATTLAFTGPDRGGTGDEPAHVGGRGDARRTSSSSRRAAWRWSGPARARPPRASSEWGGWPSPTRSPPRSRARLAAGRSMAGLRVLVTAGGTREPLDAVRYIGNRSSRPDGRGGRRRGRPPRGGRHADPRGGDGAPVGADARRPRRDGGRARAGDRSLRRPAADVIVMAAAVSDYRPAAADDGQAHQVR